MAIELWPHGSPGSNRVTSPRLSFSQEFNQTDGLPIEHTTSHQQSPLDLEPSDFDFCLAPSFGDLESSSADELFSNGFILPTRLKKKQPLITDSNSTPPPPPPPPDEGDDGLDQQQQQQQQQQGSNPKSFWGFKRSRSFSCGSFRGKGLCPLPLLSRSKSTGSDSSSKRSLVPKEDRQHPAHPLPPPHHNSYYKLISTAPPQKNTSSSSSSLQQRFSRRPLKKNSYGGALGNNNGMTVTVNPVLNMPSGNLFGLGSMFKDKGKKK